jgi:hypothetical protein
MPRIKYTVEHIITELLADPARSEGSAQFLPLLRRMTHARTPSLDRIALLHCGGHIHNAHASHTPVNIPGLIARLVSALQSPRASAVFPLYIPDRGRCGNVLYG